MRARPVATMAYSEPRVRPWTSCSTRSLKRSLRLDRDLLEHLQLAAADLDQEHVDERLVGVVELDAPHRGVGDVHLLERVADRLAVGLPRLLDGLLDGGGDRVAERDGGQ